MNRRGFLRVTTGGAVVAAAGMALRPLAALADAADGATVLYDPRFAAARAHAGALAGSSHALRAVSGDPTALALELAAGAGPHRLCGVTTESVPFCLSQLATRDPRSRLTLHRIDRDLFAWQLVIPA